MAVKTWHKLVRDKVCEGLEKRGVQCETRILSKEELKEHLLLKLIEEANECRIAGPELDDELADVLEVVDAIIAVKPGITMDHVRARQAQKRMFKGGFEQGVFLLTTEESDE